MSRSEPGRCLVPPRLIASYEDARYDNASGQRAIQCEDGLLPCELQRETRPSETLRQLEELAYPFHDQLLVHAVGRPANSC